MKVNFVGSFTTGYVGEVSDESHLAREIETLGHEVRRLPRDKWREHVLTGATYPDMPTDLEADINIVAKWNGFNDGRFVSALRQESGGAPVFYWVWDYMQNEDWHLKMVEEADLYLANDVYSGNYDHFSNCYYFPFDVSDGEIDKTGPDYESIKRRNVAFFGSWIAQGDRQEWLQKINREVPVTVFSWNWQEWPKEFTDVHPAVYGLEFANEVGITRICLGFSVYSHAWGYWSNRTGKILSVGGFLLYQYAPGMELFLQDGVVYFSSPEEAVEKIRYYLDSKHEQERWRIALKGYRIGRNRFISAERVKELMILAERFIKKGDVIWKL
ncbi:MAG: hypothetical protein A2Y53_03690 [Chloroflexi bacterium RBG_16_47_49]|nr:MAG: hypothetical protein A2Y53_03690 [Chloroflexi bacterium RBG_16_47_49]